MTATVLHSNLAGATAGVLDLGTLAETIALLLQD